VLCTADFGYLTRCLVDVAQDVIVRVEDCGIINGIWVRDITFERVKNESIYEKIAGRVVSEDITVDGKVLVAAGTSITDENARKIIVVGVLVKMCSVLVCEVCEGVCCMCYGCNLVIGKVVEIGEVVGVIVV